MRLKSNDISEVSHVEQRAQFIRIMERSKSR